MQVLVHDDADATADAVARRVADLISEHSERFTLGLAGGSTPATSYRLLRGLATGWAKVDAWLSDERWEPPDSERSNGRMAAEALLDHIDARFHRPRWSEFLEPSDSAAHYEAVIRSIHDEHRPDVVLLGLGEDGHTASLFPDTRALNAKWRWIVANPVSALDETRITATYHLLWRARLLIVQAVGLSKAEAVRDSMAGKTPASRLAEGDAEVEWFLDTESASLIS